MSLVHKDYAGEESALVSKTFHGGWRGSIFVKVYGNDFGRIDFPGTFTDE